MRTVTMLITIALTRKVFLNDLHSCKCRMSGIDACVEHSDYNAVTGAGRRICPHSIYAPGYRLCGWLLYAVYVARLY